MKLTVQGWQNLVLSVMGLVVLSGAVGGAVLMSRTDQVAAELIDHIQPARVAAYELQAALRDQETAVRGYAIAADRQFLNPYQVGQRTEASAAQNIRADLAGRADLIGDLDAIERAANDWRAGYAEPLIASVTPGRPAVVDAATAERGKNEFDGLRDLFDVQNGHLGQARSAAIDELDWVRSWRDGVLVAMVVAFLVMGVLLAVVVRNAVTRPLDLLAASCRRITEGNFGERIVARGPRDIRAIAADVEDMPMSRPMTCRSRCARSRRSANCWKSATGTSSTSVASNTSTSPSTVPSACRCSSTTCSRSPASDGSTPRIPRSTSMPPWTRH